MLNKLSLIQSQAPFTHFDLKYFFKINYSCYLRA